MMKKFLALVLAAAMLLPFAVIEISAADVWDGSEAESFASGNGTETAPYVIKTGAQLAYLAKQVAGGEAYVDAYFVLGNDINLNDQEWTPIGSNSMRFKGSFDGKGYTVSGIKIVGDTDLIYGGLFGFVDNVATNGYFKNLVITDSSIKVGNENPSEDYNAGAAAGLVKAKNVSSIIVGEGVEVICPGSVGGVFGRIVGGTVEYIVNNATVTGMNYAKSYAGGICGILGGNATLSYSANHGEVSGTAVYHGGIAGLIGGAGGGGTVQSCYNNGTVEYKGTGNGFVGGIVGSMGLNDNAFADTLTDTYNLGEISKPNDGSNAKKRIGEITAHITKNETVTLTNVYSIDIDGIDPIFKTEGTATLTNNGYGNKLEGEIKALTDAIDATIAEHITYPITVDGSAANGTVTADKTAAVKGETVTLTAVPAEGYVLDYIQVNGEEINGSSFEMPEEAVTVTAAFKKASYAVTIDAGITNGTVEADKETATKGETVTLTVTPAAGYKLDYIQVNGTGISGSSFEMPAEAVTITAAFTVIPTVTYTVTLDDAIVNGTVEADKATAGANETVTLTVTPAEGYMLTGITVNGTPIDGLTFKMPAENTVVSAVFEKLVYTVTLDNDGTIDTQTVPHGECAVKPADPTKSGYTFLGWFNGDEAYDFTAAVTANLTLTAKWEKALVIRDDNLFFTPLFALVALYARRFDVQLTGENCSISGDTTIRYKRSGTIEISVEEGYEIVDVIVNGEALGPVTSVTLKKVVRNPELIVQTRPVEKTN